MPQHETMILRMPRRELGLDIELRVTHRARDVHVREWWLPPSNENSIPTNRGVAIRPSELDEVIAALTEAKKLSEYTRAPWRNGAPCPRCQNPARRQERQATTGNGSFPTDYYCDRCGAVGGPLREEVPVIDLTNDEDHWWLHRLRQRRREQAQREGTTDSAG